MDSSAPTETTAPLWLHQSRRGASFTKACGFHCQGPRGQQATQLQEALWDLRTGLRTAATAHRPLDRGGGQGEFLHARQRFQTLQAGTVPSPFYRRKLRLGKSVMDPICRVSPAGTPCPKGACYKPWRRPGSCLALRFNAG